jgi:hypothetical protein
MLDHPVSSPFRRKKKILSATREESHAPGIETHVPPDLRPLNIAKANS